MLPSHPVVPHGQPTARRPATSSRRRRNGGRTRIGTHRNQAGPLRPTDFRAGAALIDRGFLRKVFTPKKIGLENNPENAGFFFKFLNLVVTEQRGWPDPPPQGIQPLTLRGTRSLLGRGLFSVFDTSKKNPEIGKLECSGSTGKRSGQAYAIGGECQRRDLNVRRSFVTNLFQTVCSLPGSLPLEIG